MQAWINVTCFPLKHVYGKFFVWLPETRYISGLFNLITLKIRHRFNDRSTAYDSPKASEEASVVKTLRYLVTLSLTLNLKIRCYSGDHMSRGQHKIHTRHKIWEFGLSSVDLYSISSMHIWPANSSTYRTYMTVSRLRPSVLYKIATGSRSVLHAVERESNGGRIAGERQSNRTSNGICNRRLSRWRAWTTDSGQRFEYMYTWRKREEHGVVGPFAEHPPDDDQLQSPRTTAHGFPQHL